VGEKTKMNPQHATPAKSTQTQPNFARALKQEAIELDALHTGLVRRLDAWRGAHDAATSSLNTMLARIDAALERVNARNTQS
jgi:hypothetical protein